jgi:hypothetical protein
MLYSNRHTNAYDLYGIECLMLTEEQMRGVTAKMRFLRAVVGYLKTDHTRNEYIREETETTYTNKTIKTI